MQISPRNLQLLERALKRAQTLCETDPQAAAAIATPEDTQYLFDHSQSSVEHLQALFTRFADRPCLGTRAGAGFATQTYVQVWERARRLAGAVDKAGWVNKQDAVGIYGFASADWMKAHVACNVLWATSVPLRTGLSLDDLRHIINEAELTCVVASAELLPRLQQILPECPSVRGVVVMDGDSAQMLAVPSVNLSSLEREGALAPIDVSKRDSEALMAILYTSGSTGRPKGAMLPESIYHPLVSGVLNSSFPKVPMVSLGYLPLNHLAGLAQAFQTLRHGGTVQFVQKSDMSTLFDDLRAARPTFLFLVPRVADMAYQAFISACVQQGNPDDPAVRERVMASMRHTFMGDRLLFCMAGTAPTAPEVMKFLQDCFDMPVFNGYGATENSAVTFEDHIMRDVITDYKLADVPELGYRTTDKPYPRGELRIKSPLVIPGYFKNPEATAGLRDEDGFMRTGDIVEERGPDHVVWIDRKHNVLKLSQGEFVQVSHLENLFAAQSPFIEQVYIYGTSQRSYLLAVLVPNMRNVHARLGDTCAESAVKALLREEVDRIARTAQIQPFEIPRDFVVQAEPFTKENGLLTESSKPARPQLKQAFGPTLEALYNTVEERSRAALHALRDRTDMSVADKVLACVTATLGLHDVKAEGNNVSFLSLGGDSLTGVQLSTMLQEVCGVTPPVGMLLDSSTPLAALIATVERLQEGKAPGGVSFASIHGANATVARADDLALERFLPDIPDAPGAPAQAQHILLTGANGFLGRFLLLELLAHAQAHNGSVTALVRGRDDAAAKQRILDAFADSGAQVQERLRQVQSALHVRAGDLMQPRLGLQQADYDDLCARIDTVVHNGALVNHALTYPQLFEPNVLGTVELMRLCTQTRQKALTFVSTVGVLGGIGRPVSEHETGRMLWGVRPIDQGYASGYATSKWAAEVLLQQLAERHNIPVNVVRSGMIMAHTSLAGQVNTTDFVTRLLIGLVHTGLRPGSFYESPGAHHFDGTPVDVVAATIAGIALHKRQGHQLFHAINNHDDGMSLDSFADAVASAGYPLRRIDNYDAWYKQFSQALEALPRSVRDSSPFPILFQWQHPSPDAAEVRMHNEHFAACVRELTPFGDIPHLSEAFVHTTLRHMVVRDLIAPPRRSERAAVTQQASATK